MCYKAVWEKKKFVLELLENIFVSRKSMCNKYDRGKCKSADFLVI